MRIIIWIVADDVDIYGDAGSYLKLDFRLIVRETHQKGHIIDPITCNPATRKGFLIGMLASKEIASSVGGVGQL